MRYTPQLFCAFLSVGVLVGCEKSSSTTPPAADSTVAPAPETTAAPPDAAPMIDKSQSSMEKAGAALQRAGASAATQPAAAVDAGVTTQAQQLLDQATTYIKENKMDLADKSLTQLEALKPKLPPEWASKVDSARSTFNTAKSGASKLNGLLPGAK